MTADLLVRVDDARDPVVVTVHGRVFYNVHEPLRETLVQLAAGEQRRIVVDLADVPVCDSSGLNLLVQAHRRAVAGGGWLRLAAPQPMVRRVLEITRLTRVLPVYDSVTEAAAGAE